MEELLVARLKASSGVAALCADRIYWGRAKQGAAYPYVRLSLISAPGDYTLKSDSGFRQDRVQVDVFSTAHTDATAIIRAIRAELSGAAWDVIQSVFVQNARDLNAPTSPDEPFHKSIDLMVTYSQS